MNKNIKYTLNYITQVYGLCIIGIKSIERCKSKVKSKAIPVPGREGP
jgi:hypothetical protein